PLAALTLGGIWNAQVVPASRQSFLQWLVLLLLVGLAVLGARAWWTGHGRSRATRLLVLRGLGLGVAVVSWLVPEAGYWLARTIPGGGVLRDGGRSLALCLPVAAGLPATGAGVLARTLA